jgi:SNF family Na+-dependent transporter
MTRERWGKRTAFVMAAIGSAVGLGGVWRFPYIAYSNGGGAFFIPYLIALITTGIPLVSLEYYLGTRYQRGPTEVYGQVKRNTNFIGWFSILSSAMILCYYTIVMAWAFNYVRHAIGVAWAGNEAAFFFENVLGRSENIGSFGGIQWAVVFGNFLTWAAMYVIISRGVKMIGKVINWFVIIPLILLAILIIRGVTLPGAAQGLNYYLEPNLALLLQPRGVAQCIRPGIFLSVFGIWHHDRLRVLPAERFRYPYQRMDCIFCHLSHLILRPEWPFFRRWAMWHSIPASRWMPWRAPDLVWRLSFIPRRLPNYRVG